MPTRANSPSLVQAIADELTAERLLDDASAVVVGVSGGADSVALLHVLDALNRQLGWRLRLCAAHLNHQLRGQASLDDEAFVRSLAESLGCTFHVAQRDVGRLAQESGLGIEEVGRRERYAFFHRVCLKTGARVVAIAHHADDNAETILHRILRGTGLRGVSGIPRSRPIYPGEEIQVIRPLLRRSRAELREFLAAGNHAFRDDQTNADNEPTRNRLRNTIMPLLASEVNPSVVEALNRLGEQATWAHEYVSSVAERTLEAVLVAREAGRITLHAQSLAHKRKAVQAEVLRLAYRALNLGERNLSHAQLLSALEIVATTAGPREVHWPCGAIIERRYDEVIVSVGQSDEPPVDVEVFLHVPGQVRVNDLDLEFECAELPASPRDDAHLAARDRWTEYIDRAAIEPPLVIRTRRPGDAFSPLGSTGTKKLSDFLIDEKVPAGERGRVALVCDRGGIVWVAGYRIADRVKLTAASQVALRLHARTANQ